MEVRAVMQTPVFQVTLTSTVAAAARQMDLHGVGSLVVTNRHHHIVGLLTDRDLAISLGRGATPSVLVEDVMSTRVTTISEFADAHEVVALMESGGMRRLPVVDEAGRPVGVVSVDDLFVYLTRENLALGETVRAQGGAPS